MIQTNYEVVFITIKGGLKWKKLFSRTKSECTEDFAVSSILVSLLLANLCHLLS